MANFRRHWRWIIVLIIAGGIGFFIFRATRPKPLQVAVKPITRGIVERTVANTRAGTVKACRRAKLSPNIGGQIARLPIQKGDSVKKGQLLLELWNEDLSAQAILTEREAASAQSRAHAACLRAEVSQRDADRQVKLRKSQAVSEERTDNAVSQAAALRAECEAARTEVTVRNAQLAVVRANLERTRLLAPFNGVIAEINGELFEYVTPSPVGIPTPPAVDIIDNECFYVTAPIDEVDAAGIRDGMPARITMDAFANRSFEGRVRRIADYVLDAEKQARTVDVEVSFSKPEDIKDLLAGYSADIEVILDVRKDVIRAPTEAVMDGRKVYVFSPAIGKLALRQIRAGLANWDLTEVIEGLTVDELVVVNVDNPDLADNAAAVRIKEEP
jgi:HlyD family secretion protein